MKTKKSVRSAPLMEDNSVGFDNHGGMMTVDRGRRVLPAYDEERVSARVLRRRGAHVLNAIWRGENIIGE